MRAKTQPDPGKKSIEGVKFENPLDLLEELHAMIKAGGQDRSLAGKAKHLYQLLKSSEMLTLNPERYWEAIFIIYEVLDYADDEQAAEVVIDGKALFDQLQSKKTSGDSPELIREKIRVSLAWVNAEFYRRNLYQQALSKINELGEHLNDIKREGFPCWGTTAMFHFFKARVLKQLGDFRSAIECIETTIEMYHRRAEYKKEEHGQKGRHNRAARSEQFSATRVAIALTSLGWIHVSQGSLKQALCEIAPARFMLEQTTDLINQGFVYMLLGATTRALAGKDEAMLTEALRYIERAIYIFDDHSNRRLMNRALYEKATALYNSRTNLEKLAQASEIIARVKEFSKERRDVRWLANCLILESRIKRREGEMKGSSEDYRMAIDRANEAIELSDKFKQNTCMLEGFIVRGAANINLGKHQEAQKDLGIALQMLRKLTPKDEWVNPRLFALIELQLARSYAEIRNFRQASFHLSEYKRIEHKVEHGGVRELADEVRNTIESLEGGFFIPRINPKDPKAGNKLKYKPILKSLQSYLLQEAEDITPDRSEQARILGVSRQTIYQWYHDLSGDAGNASKKTKPKR